ncbi:MFS transporter [Candidatus Aerophobetes bacterium]|nr:MFS transporter [Candidatus Aerophobetes bacterium]
MKRKNNFLFYIVSFLTDIVIGVVLLASPLLAIKLKADSLQLGGLGFIVSIFYILFCIPFGKLSDRWRRKYMVVLGCFLYLFSSLSISLATCFFHLLIFMALIGIAGAMFWPSFEAWIAERGKGKLIKRISFFNVSWSLGVAIGPLICGILFELNYRFPFYFAALLSGGVIYLILKKLPAYKGEEKVIITGGISPVKDCALENSYLNLARIANFTGWFAIGTVRYLFPKLSVEIGIQPTILGILIFLPFISQALFFYILGFSSRWHYRLFPLVFFQILGAVGILCIFLIPSLFVFGISFIFLGMTTGISYFSSIFYSLSSSQDKGKKASIHEVFLGGGALAGPLIGGIFAQIYNLKVPYLIASLVILAGIIIEIYLARKSKGQKV